MGAKLTLQFLILQGFQKKSPVVFQILKHTGYRFLSNLQSRRAGGGLSHAMSSFQGLIEPIRRWVNLVIKKRKDG